MSPSSVIRPPVRCRGPPAIVLGRYRQACGGVDLPPSLNGIGSIYGVPKRNTSIADWPCPPVVAMMAVEVQAVPDARVV